MELDAIQLAFLRREQLYAENVWKWVSEQVLTLDEANSEKARFPYNKRYLRELFWVFDNFERVLWLPKSRRTMVSWSVACYITHKARYFDHNFIMVQSRTEKEAAYLVGERCKFIEDNLVDDYSRKKYESKKTKDGLVGKIKYLGTNSSIWALPEGPDILRGYTPSLLVLDEVDHQYSSKATYNSIVPQLEKDARVILLGSSNGPGNLLSGVCKEVGFYHFSDLPKLKKAEDIEV